MNYPCCLWSCKHSSSLCYPTVGVPPTSPISVPSIPQHWKFFMQYSCGLCLPSSGKHPATAQLLALCLLMHQCEFEWSCVGRSNLGQETGYDTPAPPILFPSRPNPPTPPPFHPLPTHLLPETEFTCSDVCSFKIWWWQGSIGLPVGAPIFWVAETCFMAHLWHCMSTQQSLHHHKKRFRIVPSILVKKFSFLAVVGYLLLSSLRTT